MKNEALKKITYLAVFCSLCFVSTLLIIIPLPNGYVNAGDVLVLLAGWCLGPIGFISAALGSALADILSGYLIYAPVTFVVKGLVAFVGYCMYKFTKKCFRNDKIDFLPRLMGALVAEVIMVLGYFIFESALYGFAGGAVALLGNSMQGLFCAIGATFVVSALYNIKQVKAIFPKLVVNKNEDK